jgi:hypothetical protein
VTPNLDDAFVAAAPKTERSGAERIATARRVASSQPIPWREHQHTMTRAITGTQAGPNVLPSKTARPWHTPRCKPPRSTWITLAVIWTVTAGMPTAWALLH